MNTRETVEKALDSGRLSVNMGGRKPWGVRRNGQTKTWKREPDRFRIPVKIGFRHYGAIEAHNLNEWIIEEPKS